MPKTRIPSFILGLFAAWPFFILAVAVVTMSVTRFQPPSSFVVAWVVMTIICAIGWLFYIFDVLRNDRVPAEKRALWVALLVIGGPMVMPFYFWNYVRNSE